MKMVMMKVAGAVGALKRTEDSDNKDWINIESDQEIEISDSEDEQKHTNIQCLAYHTKTAVPLI